MNDISKRTYFALALTGVLLFGLVAFVVRFFLFSDRWVTFSGNPHVYHEGVLDTGVVRDRSGVLLLDTEGGRTYAEDSATRRATVHILGDRQGNIPSQVLTHYASTLVGYDQLSGTKHSSSTGELKLTVSAQAEVIATQALNGRKGAVGVYNYKTGEILCAMSSPTLDPDNPPSEVDDSSGLYVYRMFHAAYTPGSIFKLVTAVAAMESLPDITAQSFTCTGSTVINGETISCPYAHGTLSFKDALAHSCNCAFARIAVQVGSRKLSEVAERIGVNQSFSFDGLYTRAGNFDLAGADQNAIAWAGVGQHTDLVNPYQFLRFMGAVANGGSAAEPYLVAEAKNNGKVRYRAKTGMTDALLTEEDAVLLQQMMRYNVEAIYGTWNFPGVQVCAKSGTAETGGDSNTATFAGFVLDERYPLAFIVVVEEGGAGSATCAPIAGSVLQACINVMDGEG